MVPEIGVLSRSCLVAIRYSGVCTAKKYGMPLAGSVQKFGETCSDELRLMFMSLAIALTFRPSSCARVRSIV